MTAPFTGPDRRKLLAADASGAHMQRKDAEARASRAEQQRDELLAALQPFVARNSSDETITITVRTADIQRARAAIAKATGSRA